jgi:GTPase SAR1 family protein
VQPGRVDWDTALDWLSQMGYERGLCHCALQMTRGRSPGVAGQPIRQNMPQIVVVGCQSAGKSSVLEAIVDGDFLPRGSNICTHRPVVFHLIHVADTKNEWAEFLHKLGQKFTDFNHVRDEIDADTNRICGSKKGVKDIPISLKICSPNVLNFTLVDLAGLTKIAIEDQPANIP